MADVKNKFLMEEYISRINKVQDYIDSHLEREFSLEELSRIANFSPYHFHRIFRTLTGEPLFQYIQRVRLEKATYFLLANPKDSITQIALKCGFTNQASFARAFKRHYNISASGLRKNRLIEKSKESKVDSNGGKEIVNGLLYNQNTSLKRSDSNRLFLHTVEVKEIKKMHAVYIRHKGLYKKNVELFTQLFKKLFTWAEARGIVNLPETKWLTLYHNSSELTVPEKERISVCMVVAEGTPVDGEIGMLTIASGKYAVGHFVLKEDQFQEAWNVMYAQWLPKSGYQPDDRLSFELYPNNQDYSEKKIRTDIYIPIKPL